MSKNCKYKSGFRAINKNSSHGGYHLFNILATFLSTIHGQRMQEWKSLLQQLWSLSRLVQGITIFNTLAIIYNCDNFCIFFSQLPINKYLNKQKTENLVIIKLSSWNFIDCADKYIGKNVFLCMLINTFFNLLTCLEK